MMYMVAILLSVSKFERSLFICIMYQIMNVSMLEKLGNQCSVGNLMYLALVLGKIYCDQFQRETGLHFLCVLFNSISCFIKMYSY